MAPLEVTDSISLSPQQIDTWTEELKRSPQARAVLKAIYTGKKQPKDIPFIKEKTGINSNVRVLQITRRLENLGLVDIKREGRQSYFYKVKNVKFRIPKILSLSTDKKRLKKFKERLSGWGAKGSVISFRIPKHIKPRAIQLTIDDIDSFGLVKKIPLSSNNSLKPIPERKFNNGVRKILGGLWEQKDWGGEDDDLSLTNLKYKGRRLSTAFAFKGPAAKPPLTLKKMGKNGDQILRLFKNDMELYVLQYQGEIAPHITQEMAVQARNRSIYAGAPVYYLIINGQDSVRLVKAYSKKFK